MAETYHEDAAAEHRAGDGLLTDSRLKWFGVVVAGGFTLLIAYVIFRILTDFVDYELLVTIFPRFIKTYIDVLVIVVVSSVLSLIGGVFIGLGRVSKTKFTRTVATGYVEFFRGTPLLFQLFVIFIGLPRFGIGNFSSLGMVRRYHRPHPESRGVLRRGDQRWHQLHSGRPDGGRAVARHVLHQCDARSRSPAGVPQRARRGRKRPDHPRQGHLAADGSSPSPNSSASSGTSTATVRRRGRRSSSSR